MATDSVRIVLFNHDEPDHFLILCESDDLGTWKLPGGKIEGEESPTEAVIRELNEEMGLDPHQINVKFAAQLVTDDGSSARYIYGGLIKKTDVRPSAEVAEIQWVTEDGVPEGRNKQHILSAVKVARIVIK